MKRGQVIALSDYKAQRQMRTQPARNAGASKGLTADHLRQLLDRNLSLRIWKKGI